MIPVRTPLDALSSTKAELDKNPGNGKVRGRITLPKDATEDQALAAAHEIPNIASQLQAKTLRKTIWVPNKILNLIA